MTKESRVFESTVDRTDRAKIENVVTDFHRAAGSACIGIYKRISPAPNDEQ